MLNVLSQYLALAPRLAVVWAAVAKHDSELAAQGRSNSSSVALNTAEGYGSRGGNKRLRYQNAYASLKECMTTLRWAMGSGYLGDESALVNELDCVAASLWRLTQSRACLSR